MHYAVSQSVSQCYSGQQKSDCPSTAVEQLVVHHWIELINRIELFFNSVRYVDPDGVTYRRWPLNISQCTDFKWLAATTCMWLTFNSIPLPVISIMLQSQNTQAQQSQSLLKFTACFEFCATETVKLIPAISCSNALLVILSNLWNCYKRVEGLWPVWPVCYHRVFVIFCYHRICLITWYKP